MPTLKPNQNVRLLRDIYRLSHFGDKEYTLYARKGDEGMVIETFQVRQSPNQQPVWHAKVLMDTEVKTFRITSLEKV